MLALQPYVLEAVTLRVQHALALARVARHGHTHDTRVEAVGIEVEERHQQSTQVVHSFRRTTATAATAAATIAVRGVCVLCL